MRGFIGLGGSAPWAWARANRMPSGWGSRENLGIGGALGIRENGDLCVIFERIIGSGGWRIGCLAGGAPVRI
jgi:hypothetical protein